MNIYSCIIHNRQTVGKTNQWTSMDKWANKAWYTYMVEYYTVMKNEVLAIATKWMNLESIILNEKL